MSKISGQVATTTARKGLKTSGHSPDVSMATELDMFDETMTFWHLLSICSFVATNTCKITTTKKTVFFDEMIKHFVQLTQVENVPMSLHKYLVLWLLTWLENVSRNLLKNIKQIQVYKYWNAAHFKFLIPYLHTRHIHKLSSQRSRQLSLGHHHRYQHGHLGGFAISFKKKLCSFKANCQPEAREGRVTVWH